MSYKNYVSLLALLLLLSPLKLMTQPKPSFNLGSVRLANTELQQGYIWISSTLEGEQIIYYKMEEKSPVIKYTPSDVLTIDLASREAKYISEAILVDGYYKRVILQVHFKGEFDLVSYYNPQENLFFLVDNNDQFVELKNTYQKPERSNDFKFRYYQEYKETLIEILGGNPGILDLIHKTEFDPKEISDVLIKYHKQREIQYETFPPRRFSGFYAGVGTAVSTISHTSDINEEFSSQSPFIGGMAKAGARFFDNKLEFSFLLRYNYGIISHDNTFSPSSLVTLYYEDIIKTSILSEGIGVKFSPIKYGRISLGISGAAYYNQFFNYSREVFEEIFYEAEQLVINNYFDSFDKPDSYLSVNYGAGLDYELNKYLSVSLAYSRSMIFESNSGINNLHSISLMVNKNF